MKSSSRQIVAGMRKYTEAELETMIRQTRIEGGTLEDIEVELNVLADHVRDQANNLQARWSNLMDGTGWEDAK